MNHNVPSRGDLLSVQSYGFAQPAPDAIALHRASQRLFDAPAEPADAEAIGAKKNSELAARPPAPFAIHRVVFNAMHQPAGARQIERGASDARETVASLLPALREYFASTLALHARAKPVFLVAGAHVRLKCPFRHRSLSSAWLALLGGGLRARIRFEA